MQVVLRASAKLVDDVAGSKAVKAHLFDVMGRFVSNQVTEAPA
jgi:hypothetical protein